MKQNKVMAMLPVLFGFFVMGFCDLVGIASNYIKQDFGLTDAEAGFIPSMVFIWFFVFSLPVGLLMRRIGRKNVVLASMVLTVVALIIPFVSYTYVTALTAFALIGIGNTILQVSLNPLMSNLLDGKQLASGLTAGQFVKAISSFCGPIIAGWAFAAFGDWRYMFPVFAAITLVATVWLFFTPVPREQTTDRAVSFGAALSLLKDKSILMLFLGILFIVGIDVGINTVTPKLLMERCGMSLQEAGYGTSLYFACRTVGAFIGALLLARLSAVLFFRISMVVSAPAFVLLFFVTDSVFILAAIGVLGFFCANVFSILFSQAMLRRPDYADEISGLMIMGVSGGAVVTPLMGMLSEWIGSQQGSLIVLAVCLAYLTVTAFVIKSSRESIV